MVVIIQLFIVEFYFMKNMVKRPYYLEKLKFTACLLKLRSKSKLQFFERYHNKAFDS
jgi:hypothetical protein